MNSKDFLFWCQLDFGIMEGFTEGINIGSEYGRIRIWNGSEGNGDLQS